MFDDALLESRKTHALGAKRLSLPVAIALHLAIVGAFVGASAWVVEDPPEVDRIWCTLGVIQKPPPPKGDGETPRPSHARKSQPAVAMTQPDASRVEPVGPVQQDVEISPIEAGPATGGPGSSQGVPDSTGEETGGSGKRAGGEEKILPVGGDVRAPELLARVEPDYPEAARRAHLQGTVILEAIITSSGAVQEIRILKSVNPLLDEAAERAVRAWRYRPATLNGRAVPVYLTVTVRFGIAT